jgi:multidrug efflux pump
MKLSETAIRRPVLASMLSAALVLFGVIGYTRLSVRELPDIDPPIISVTTVLPGANAQVVETAVTDVLEEELSTIQGIRTLSSSSAEQTSNITLEFTLDRPVDVAAQDVRDKVSRVRGRLPVDVLEPVIAKQSADAQPFFWLALSSDNYDLMQLSDVADRLVKARLQSLPGVGSAQIFGERRYSMRVWVDPQALSARELTVQDVENAIASRNVEIPAGRIESTRREFSVRSLGELKTPQEFGEMVVASRGTQLIKLKDVARVELGPEDDRSIFRWKSTPSVAIGVVRQSKANLLNVAKSIRAELPAIQQTLPAGIKLESAFDGSKFVTHSIDDAKVTLLIAAILVVLIIFVFLRNVRATIIPGLAIPASIIATFAIMYFLGFSINNFTLLALTIAIGIVVDDAIIVLENAFRHQEELHEAPEEAAVRGTNEIGFAVIATTIALVAVFSPLAFLTGTAGRLLSEFGIAVAGAVVISGFVALTLTPMLCAKILRMQHQHGAMFQMFERGFKALSERYTQLLRKAIDRRRLVFWGTIGGVALTVFFLFGWPPARLPLLTQLQGMTRLQSELIPEDDRGFFLVVVRGPEGASLPYTDGYVRQVESIIGRTPGVNGYFTIVGGFAGGVNSAFIGVIMQDGKRPSVNQTIGGMFPQLMGISGVLAFPYAPGAIGFSQPIQYVVQNPDFAKLTAMMGPFVGRVSQIKGLANVQPDLFVNKPELRVTFDRDRAEDLGVPVRDVAGALQTFLGGRRVSTFTRNDKLYYVMVQLDPKDRATPSDMGGIYLRGKNGQLVQLDALANVQEGVGARQINHFNRIPSFTLSASVTGLTQGTALDSIDAVAKQMLPPGTTTALAGESREYKESGSAIYFAFVIALIVVFMVLASQFESLLHPLTVLTAVPLAVAGALLTLKFAAVLHRSGATLNLYSQIGMILLIGLVAKNSILLVEYTNQLREKGMDAVSALLEAGRIRLRPILMTSVATIMGAAPVAYGFGAGSAARKPLGYAIVGGVFFSTALTLFVVPAAYLVIPGIIEWLRTLPGRLYRLVWGRRQPVTAEGD